MPIRRPKSHGGRLTAYPYALRTIAPSAKNATRDVVVVACIDDRTSASPPASRTAANRRTRRESVRDMWSGAPDYGAPDLRIALTQRAAAAVLRIALPCVFDVLMKYTSP